MSANKNIYPEYYTKEEYEKELDKSLKLGCVEHALLFYHFCRYAVLHSIDFISSQKYYELCDFLSENIQTLPKGIQEYVNYEDVLTYDCKLGLAPSLEQFEKGKHLLPNINSLLDHLEDRVEIDFKLKVVEEVDSIN